MNRSSLSSRLGLAVSALVLSTIFACGGATTGSSDADGGGVAPSPAPTSTGTGTNASAGCHETSDCPGFETGPDSNSCFGPTNTCGPVEECTVDTDCTVSGEVCTARPNGLVSCRPPCGSDDDCAPTDACSASGHCNARTCANCPSFLTCDDGACVATSCTADAECPGGYCVDGSCADRLGVCQEACL